MKKGVKILIFVAIGVIVLGIGVCALSLAVGGFDLQKYSFGEETELLTKNIAIKDAFSSVDVDMETGDIIFVPSKDDSCSVESVVPDKAEFSAEVRDGTLYVVCKDTRKWYEKISLFNMTKEKVTLTLPVKDYTGLNIVSTSSDLHMPNDFSFENAAVKIITGDVNFAAKVKNKQSFDVTTGDLCVSESSPKELSVKCFTGNMQFSDIGCDNMDVVNTTGDIALNNTVSTGDMTIRLTTGDVAFSSCDAKDIAVKLTTGDVSGTLLSDKEFKADTVTGDVNVPDTTSDGTCEVKVVTGDINLKVDK